MLKKPSKLYLRKYCRNSVIILSILILLTAMPSCSGDVQESEQATTALPTVTVTAAPTPMPTTEPSPTDAPTVTPEPEPTPEPSFPDLSTDTSGAYIYPQVVADKTSAKTNEPVYFKIVTSEKVNKIQTVVDGETLKKIYTEYTSDSNVRIWEAKVLFTKDGNRKVQFKCTLSTGGTATIPKTPITIKVAFNYTAASTSKTINSGKMVTFTLKTPSSITSVAAVVDGVKQNVPVKSPDSDNDGVKVWKYNLTFFKPGTREVQFNAYAGSRLKMTFPDPGITIIVQSSE
jgi:hypothetical protein